MTEFSLIEQLTQNITLQNPSSVKGVGDDAAVLSMGNVNTLICSNMMLEGVHFDLTYTPLKHLGYKAAVINFADIYAMNGYPRQLLVAIGVSAKLSAEQISELYAGILLACEHYKVDVVGGDTTTSLTGLTLALTAVGECDPQKIIYRTGAQPTDLVCLSGNVGAAYMGLLILEREKKVFEAGGKNPQLADYEYVIGKYLKPAARQDLIDNLREMQMQPTAMIDISKGLATETLLLCKQSNVGVRLYLDKIPIARETNVVAGELNFNAATAALNGGEDYEMLFTLPLAMHDKIKDLGKIDIIGHIVAPEKGAFLVTSAGSEIPLTAQGFNE
ncbi:thiamine-monophosphate kinase [Bacteroidia bacterium]|nr:thiamine-monophosphate kinase [Bacteroidia bacterium]